MDSINSILPVFYTNRSYCSQTKSLCYPQRKPPSSIRTVKEGMDFINQLLAKELLCWHDVQEINQIYQAIELRDRKIERLSDFNSCLIFDTLFQKAQRLLSSQPNPTNLISLYYLQNFLEKDWGVESAFHKGLEQLREGDREQIAVRLPYCCSVVHFNEDVGSLIGASFSKQSKKHLDRKIQRLEKAEQKERNIQQELTNLRNMDPNPYPIYFQELLQDGYLDLYNYLKKMKNHNSQADFDPVRKMSFSELSWVVLETRKAIIQKVEQAIPQHRSLNIVFLLGRTRVGKSTALCFLRGDKMVFNQDRRYNSADDREGILDHSLYNSCTFLPTCEVVNNLLLVDFPGFEDSNGPLISLGMELALKALIRKHHPRLLLFESILLEDNWSSVEQLAQRLNRIIDNSEDSIILGITKYSRDLDVRAIEAEESNQRKALIKPLKEEENRLIGEIASLEELLADMPELISEKEEVEEQLAQIRARIEERLRTPLEETDIVRHHKEGIKQREDKLLQVFKLQHLIQFDHLESQSNLLFLEKLSSLPLETARINPLLKLDENENKLLGEKLEEYLTELRSSPDFEEYPDFPIFKQIVLESSLVATLSSLSPEIGELLHLRETDPTIHRHADKKIVTDCMQEYMEMVVSKVSFSKINVLLQKVKGKKSEALRTQLSRLENYIIGLLGLGHLLVEDPNEAKKRLAEQEARYELKGRDVEKDYRIGKWLTLALAIPVGIPLACYKLLKVIAIRNAHQEVTDQLMDECLREVDHIHRTLLGLQELERIIKDQEALNAAFEFRRVSFSSLQDLLESIAAIIVDIRQIYGTKEWDARVSFLVDKLANSSSSPLSKGALIFLSAKCLSSLDIEFSKVSIQREGVREFQIIGKDHNILCFGEANLQGVAKPYKGFVGGSLHHFEDLEIPETVGLDIKVPLSRILSAAVFLKTGKIDARNPGTWGVQQITPFEAFQNLADFSDDIKQLTAAVGNYQALLSKDLDLHDCNWVTDRWLQAFAVGLPLLSIDLQHCRRITDAGLTALADSSPNLTTVNLYGCNQITAEKLAALRAAFPGVTWYG